jgi:23S rRNA (pseudouridine1915-N3)-methyltransferase
MSKYNIIAIGKLPSEYVSVSNHLLKLLNKKITITEISPKKNLQPPEVIDFETNLIMDKLQKTDFVILLDVMGKEVSSQEFSELLQKMSVDNIDNITFIIGGAWGVSKKLKDRANMKISLSKMTFPHMLARIILLEQIYRAHSIINNHPYHK